MNEETGQTPIDKPKATSMRTAQLIAIGSIALVLVGFLIWIANGGLYKDNTQTPTAMELESLKPSNNSSVTSPAQTPQATETPSLTEEQANELAKPPTSVEYQLAVMDAGYVIPKNAPIVKEFRKLLVELRRRTGYTFADIRQKNMFACTEVRKKTGLPIRLLGFMQISLDLVKKYPNDDYNVILAGMVVNSEMFKIYYEQLQQ